MPVWMRPFLAGAAIVALLAMTIGLVAQAQRANEADERVDELEAEVRALEAEVERLEDELEAAEATSVEEAVGELLGGPVGRMLGEMLSDGELERLLRGLAGDRDLGDLRDGLLDGGILDDLLDGRGWGDVFGRIGNTDAGADRAQGPLGDVGELLAGGVPGAACLVDAGSGGLFGSSGTELPEEPEALVEVVAEHVAELRELAWEDDVEVEFIDGEELAERLDQLLDDGDDEPRLALQERMLTALGAIPAGTDLEQLQRSLLEDQVAGYYAPEDGELVVRVPDDGSLRPLDKITLAHELDHALADQALGLPELDEPPYLEDADAALAALSVIEGDATLLMQQWAAEHLSLGQQLSGLLGGDAAGAQASFAAVPHHLQQELLFPYTAGMEYVCRRTLDGGWAAVDDDYADPPTTSLEILHPDLVDLEAEPPPDLAAPAGGRELGTTTFGAAPLQWLFEAPGGDASRALDDPAGRAEVWGGGTVTVWEVDDGDALGLSLVDRGTGPRLCGSVTAWHAAAFPEQQRARGEATTTFRGQGTDGPTTTIVRCDDDAVRYVSAGDLATALPMLGG
jgi:outer membrane murein-binding lipoprotein Lpp